MLVPFHLMMSHINVLYVCLVLIQKLVLGIARLVHLDILKAHLGRQFVNPVLRAPTPANPVLYLARLVHTHGQQFPRD